MAERAKEGGVAHVHGRRSLRREGEKGREEVRGCGASAELSRTGRKLKRKAAERRAKATSCRSSLPEQDQLSGYLLSDWKKASRQVSRELTCCERSEWHSQ